MLFVHQDELCNHLGHQLKYRPVSPLEGETPCAPSFLGGCAAHSLPSWNPRLPVRHDSLTLTTQTWEKRSVYIRWYLCAGPSSAGVSPDLSGVSACCEQKHDVPGQAVELWRLTGHDWQVRGLKLIPSSPGVFRPRIQTGPCSPPKVASSLPQGARALSQAYPYPLTFSEVVFALSCEHSRIILNPLQEAMWFGYWELFGDL